MKLRVLVLNLNNLNFTRDCINYLLNQDTKEFKITVIDQGSNERGTLEYLNSLPNEIDLIFNDENKPVNEMWNLFYDKYDDDLLCFLNNDVVIPKNFISDTLKVFEKEEKVGVVCHATNNLKYSKVKDELEYVIVPKFVNMQGWDFTIRREAFTKIPSQIKIYCGDDFLFHHLYEKGWDLAYVLSSPMIHFEGQSKKFMKTSGMEDVNRYVMMGFKHYLKVNIKFSKIKPTFNNFT